MLLSIGNLMTRLRTRSTGVKVAKYDLWPTRSGSCRGS
nr:MAG TPA: hypothetical protein [Caudoviricetes sp.]